MIDREISQDRCLLRHPVKRAFQGFVLLSALVVSIMLVAGNDFLPIFNVSGSPGTHFTSQDDQKFDMLVYLDARVARQEDKKDVRCWSSFCKLQMFLTGVQIEPGAVSVRIEKHMHLIESIRRESGAQSPNQPLIPSSAVSSVLARRFPHIISKSGATFQLEDGLKPIIIAPEAIKDYSDTIEAWRLLQTWASRHTDSAGRLTLKQQFDKDALLVLCKFFGTYDLAILKHARFVAQKNKLASIDASSMSEAFDLESKLQR